MGNSALGGVKTVLGSTWLGFLVVLWFEIASFALLGSFWGRCWVLPGSFWCFFELLKVLESSFRRRFLVFMVSLCSLLFRPRVRRFVFVNLSTYLLVYSSTHGPSTLSSAARRTARCAIKSAATRRVGACLDSFRKILRIR